MFKRILGIMIIIIIIFYQSIFSQADNFEPNINGGDSLINDATQSSSPVPEVSKNPVLIPKRDPFYPVLRDIGMSKDAYTLERYDAWQYELIGIVSGISSPKAMFRAPDGLKYILKKGDSIGRNSGVIMQIDNYQVVILERSKAFDGSVKENTVVRTLKSSS